MAESNLEKVKTIQIVGFKLNSEEYALEIENVDEMGWGIGGVDWAGEGCCGVELAGGINK